MVKALLWQRLGWKLLALAIAFGLWVTFVGSPELVTSISAPLEYENMPPNLEMSADAPDQVYLEVKGPAARLHSFDQSRIAVVLNLSGVRAPGDRTFTIARQNIDLPFGLGLVRAVPGQVRLRFERSITAEVPVRIRFASAPPEGYRVVEESTQPAKLKVVGPESRVKEIAYAETDPIDLTDVMTKAEFRVHTFVSDPQVRFSSSPEVKVTVSLERSAQGGANPHGKATVRH